MQTMHILLHGRHGPIVGILSRLELQSFRGGGEARAHLLKAQVGLLHLIIAALHFPLVCLYLQPYASELLERCERLRIFREGCVLQVELALACVDHAKLRFERKILIPNRYELCLKPRDGLLAEPSSCLPTDERCRLSLDN